jgi:hypothetical protein
MGGKREGEAEDDKGEKGERWEEENMGMKRNDKGQ